MEYKKILEDKYEILKKIGEGGMSCVYLAMDNHLNKQWAIKQIEKKCINKDNKVIFNNLMVEAEIMKKLDYPALPRIVDVFEDHENYYIVMDYIEGESLDKIVKEYGKQSEEYVLKWGKEIAGALDYLHSRNPPVIYRDMKPSNVIITPEGHVKIIDFGIAREVKNKFSSDTVVLGTVGYAPPEQYIGRTDPRSDIYAFGMTLHYLLTGIKPGSPEIYQSAKKINKTISEGMDTIINKCVEPIPDNRYQNCRELLYDLNHIESAGKYQRYKIKEKIRIFGITEAAALILIVLSLIFFVTGQTININGYKTLLSKIDSPESYIKAINLHPEKAKGYIRLLKYYESKGKFCIKESQVFLELYNSNREFMDMKKNEFAELNNVAGLMYFNYYKEGEECDIGLRVQKAFPFFYENHKNKYELKSFDNKNISEVYYMICSFYKKYILSTAKVEEASKENITRLIENLWKGTEYVKKESYYEKLLLYKSILSLMYDQRYCFPSTGYEERNVLKLMEYVYEETTRINPNKEQSLKLKSEIQCNYVFYKNAVRRAYEK